MNKIYRTVLLIHESICHFFGFTRTDVYIRPQFTTNTYLRRYLHSFQKIIFKILKN